MFSWADTGIQIASLVNLLIFLTEGKHPTLVDRVLGLQPVSIAPAGQARTVGYSYMTRELLWHGFIVSMSKLCYLPALHILIFQLHLV